MNYMDKVAKMFGVKLNEEFKLLRFPEDEVEAIFWSGEPLHDTFKVTEEGLIRIDECWPKNEVVDHDMLSKILIGEWVIVKKPWKPKFGSSYAYVQPEGEVKLTIWQDSAYDIAMYAYGNCFCPGTEAEAHKEEMLAKMKEVMGK